MKKCFAGMWQEFEKKFPWRESRKLLWIATMIVLVSLSILFAMLGYSFVSIMTFGVAFHLFPLFGIWCDKVPFKVEEGKTWLEKTLLWNPWQSQSRRIFVSFGVRLILIAFSQIVDLGNPLPILFLFTSFLFFREWQKPVVYQFHVVVFKDKLRHFTGVVSDIQPLHLYNRAGDDDLAIALDHGHVVRFIQHGLIDYVAADRFAVKTPRLRPGTREILGDYSLAVFADPRQAQSWNPEAMTWKAQWEVHEQFRIAHF